MAATVLLILRATMIWDGFTKGDRAPAETRPQRAYRRIVVDGFGSGLLGLGSWRHELNPIPKKDEVRSAGRGHWRATRADDRPAISPCQGGRQPAFTRWSMAQAGSRDGCGQVGEIEQEEAGA